MPGAERLGARLLGGEALCVGLHAVLPPVGARALGLRKDTMQKPVAVALDHFRDAAHIGDVGADAEDHTAPPALARPRSIAPRIGLDRRIETDEHRLADQKVTDIELGDLRQGRDGFGAGVIEAMAGMNFESETFRQRGAFSDARPLRRRLVRFAIGERVAPAPVWISITGAPSAAASAICAVRP